MKYLAIAIWSILSISTSLNSARGAGLTEGKCDVGPLNKTYGNASWLVYSCTTDKNVVIVSAPGNPALPFVFCFCIKDGVYRLFGEGAGNKVISDAARNELNLLGKAEIAELIRQTKQIQVRN